MANSSRVLLLFSKGTFALGHALARAPLLPCHGLLKLPAAAYSIGFDAGARVVLPSVDPLLALGIGLDVPELARQDPSRPQHPRNIFQQVGGLCCKNREA